MVLEVLLSVFLNFAAQAPFKFTVYHPKTLNFMLCFSQLYN